MRADKRPKRNCYTPFCLLAGLFIAVLTSGCIPLGSTPGREQVVASRSEPDKYAEAQIVGVPAEHHWMSLFTPEGPEMNHVTGDTWQFYLVSADGHRELLHFLEKRSGGANPWSLIAPVNHTNLWVAAIYTGSLNRIEHGHHNFRVICFNAKRIVTDTALDYPEFGEFTFDSENHVLTYEAKNRSWRFDPVTNRDLP